ncbi:MAG: FtsX-like permease family protein [Actinomycetota bacterium]
MWRATIKGLLAKKLRLVLTALSIVLGVGFVAGTYVLTDTMNAAFDELFDQAAVGTDLVVRSESAFQGEVAGPGGGGGADERLPLPAGLVDVIAAVPGVEVASGDVSGYAQMVDPASGDVIGGVGPPTIGTNWSEISSGVLELRDGRAPSAVGEVVIDAGTAGANDIVVGTTITILFQGPPEDFEVVGIAGFGDADNLGGATLALFDLPTAQRVLQKEGVVDAISVVGTDGVDLTSLRSGVQEVLPTGAEVLTSTDVADEQADALQEGLGFFRTALLVFAAIALFVGAFLIFNTFSIIVAQRTRELALLRMLGANRRQVMTSVVAEAAIVGIVASAVGILAGIGIALALQGLLQAFGIDLPSTSMQLQTRTIVASFVVGTGVTLAASILPARHAARVPPIQALREPDASARRGSMGKRVVVGGLVTAAGVAALLLGLFGDTGSGGQLVGLGAALTFIGVATLSPVLARPVAHAIGRPFGARGVAGRVGRENAIRNPRRTASTASALMIGLGLVAMVAILAASLKASFDAALSSTLRADLTLSTTSFTPFSPDVVDTASAFRSNGFRVQGEEEFLTAIDPATVEQVAALDIQQGVLADLGGDTIMVHVDEAADRGWVLGDEVPAALASIGDRPLRIVAIYGENSLVGNYAVALSTYAELYTEQLDAFVLVKGAEGVPIGDLQAAVEQTVASYPNIDVQDQASFREKQAGFIDQILGLITALLFMAILIAAFGIANTLGLSIYERTRELGLLRAVGMSRRQVRRMIRTEAVIIALFGALLGVVVGIGFGWALQQALEPEGVTQLAIPAGQLVVYLVVAALVGVLAAILPARRASKIDVLKAIAYE